MVELDAAAQAGSTGSTAGDAGLLDALPHLTLKLAEVSEWLLRALFESAQLGRPLAPGQ
jgi:hypothetical protein